MTRMTFVYIHMGVSKNVPQNGWFIMENPMNKWMIWGAHPYFWKHHNIYIYIIYIYIYNNLYIYDIQVLIKSVFFARSIGPDTNLVVASGIGRGP